MLKVIKMSKTLFSQISFPQEEYDSQRYLSMIEDIRHIPSDTGKFPISGYSQIVGLAPIVKHQKENLIGYSHLDIEGTNILDSRLCTGKIGDIWSTTDIFKQIFFTYPEKENSSDYIKPTDMVPRHIELEENEIAIVPVRELTYQDAKKEIIGYIKKVGRKVDTIEIIEELWLDIELTMQILEEIESEGDQENG